jgi:hypothetical protein
MLLTPFLLLFFSAVCSLTGSTGTGIMRHRGSGDPSLENGQCERWYRE